MIESSGYMTFAQVPDLPVESVETELSFDAWSPAEGSDSIKAANGDGAPRVSVRTATASSRTAAWSAALSRLEDDSDTAQSVEMDSVLFEQGGEDEDLGQFIMERLPTTLWPWELVEDALAEEDRQRRRHATIQLSLDLFGELPDSEAEEECLVYEDDVVYRSDSLFVES